MAQATIKTVEHSKAKKIFEVGASRARISTISTKSRLIDVLPFRVRFTTIVIPGRSSSSIPGIGLQIIGYSNYIL